MAIVVVDLLDSDQGRPLQTWQFEDQAVITLGRSPDNDVVVGDPYVSRSHAYIRQEEDHWVLVAISAQQVVSRGKAMPQLTLSTGSVFRLGPRGCCLRFGVLSERAANQRTITFDQLAMPLLQLDRRQMEAEVRQITDGSYFQQLKESAARLRESRDGDTKVS